MLYAKKKLPILGGYVCPMYGDAFSAHWSVMVDG